MSLQTVFEFTLPMGYVDPEGNLHKKGQMRLATAMDEIVPLSDPRVQANEAYIVIILLSRVITRLGTLNQMNTGVIENLFAADLAYLQEFYQRINEQGRPVLPVTCPHCQTEFEVDISDLAGE
ncbi:MAG: phage tail assembly protein [Chloroflexi bacterium]|nr:MAG: phage tail assembly protein [Chloroflexota bacterium]